MKRNFQDLAWPEPLKPGDKVAITAPSSPVHHDTLQTAIQSIRFLGLNPVIMPSCTLRQRYLSGTDSQRAKDLNQAFACRDIRAIFCLRGGYGAMRILPFLDFDMISNNIKHLIGYSDITALHTAISTQCRFVTFHGPMPNIGYHQLDTFSLNSLKHVLFHEKCTFPIKNIPGNPMRILQSGFAEGQLVGGNLTVLAGTLGSPYEIDTLDKILFIEDIGEHPYRIDRSFTSLALAGKLHDCAGIILGTFTDCEVQAHTPSADKSGSFEDCEITEIISELILPYNKPVISNLQAGHSYPQNTLPIGAAVRIDLRESGHTDITVL